MSIPLSRYWRLLSRYLASQRRLVIVLFGLIVGGTTLQVLSPLLIGRFIDEAIGDANQRSTYRAARQSLRQGFRRIADRPNSRWRARGDWCQIARFAPTWEGNDSVADVARGVAAAMVESSGDALALLHAARCR